MLQQLYSKPLRIYLFVALLAGLGVWSGLRLPISLYPNTNRPEVEITANYGNLSSEEFRKAYGASLENEIKSFRGDNLTVERVKADYRAGNVSMVATLKWGQDGQKAEDQLAARISSLASTWPEQIRESVGVWQWRRGGGFLAISFYSDVTPLGTIYQALDDALTPKLSGIADLGDHWLQNPDARDVKIQIDPARLVSSGVDIDAIEQSLKAAVKGLRAGSLQLGDNTLSIEVPPQIKDLDDFANLPVPAAGGEGQLVTLGQFASVSFEKSSDDTIFKTSGKRSLILYATPKPGANIKRMAEDVLAAVESVRPRLPEGVKVQVLVDPSAFIRSSVRHVMHEVFLGAGLASLILFLFIGSLRNVITAAIEIPISLVLAFLLMDLTGMSINLISLGGLALSAGMNVDASVVVMENIFRRLEEHKGQDDEPSRTRVVIQAVKEVWAPVVSATIASLVVFIPLLFTGGLAQALLGDLAKAVVFSHGFSCFVALLLVPTVRLHMMRAQGGFKPTHSPLERFWARVENTYGRAVTALASQKWPVVIGIGAAFAALAAAVVVLLPRLQKEIVGLPESEFAAIRVSPKSFIPREQLEEMVDGVDATIASALGDSLDYTFVQIGKGWSVILARVTSRDKLDVAIPSLEKVLGDTPLLGFRIEPWNPSELPIPNPPQLQIDITGGTPREQLIVAADVSNWLESTELYPRVYGDTQFDPGKEFLVWQPHPEIVQPLGLKVIYDVVRYLALATSSQNVAEWNAGRQTHRVMLQLNQGTVKSLQDVRATPLRIGNRIVPITALGDVSVSQAPPPVLAVNGEQVLSVYGRHGKGDESLGRARLAEASAGLQRFLEDKKETHPAAVRVEVVDAEQELTEAIRHITNALALSLSLLALILLLQFGRLSEVALVLVAVPLGLVGSIFALWIVGSTISLNSILGLILMNGLAVGNSIILVDFMNRLSREGLTPLEACQRAARTRLRPILITSLTTILGMTPIALGLGEGGKILQPLGVSVAGGLWFSTLLTLFLVPSLHVRLLERRAKRKTHASTEQALRSSVVLACVVVGGLGLESESFAQTGSPQPSLAEESRGESNRQSAVRWLQEAVDAAGETDAAQWSQSAAQIRLDGRSAWRDFMPSLTAQGEVSRAAEARGLWPGETSSDQRQWSTSARSEVGLRANLFAGGTDAALRKERQSDRTAAGALLERVRLEVMARVVALTVDMLTNRHILKNIEGRLTLLRQTLSVAEARFAKAQIARSDVARVQRQIAAADADATERRLNQAHLDRQMAAVHASPFPVSAGSFISLPELDRRLKTITLASLEAERKSPQSTELEATQRSLFARIEAEQATRWPRIDVVLASGLGQSLDPDQPGQHDYRASLNVNWTLFDQRQRALEAEALLAEERVIRAKIMNLKEQQSLDAETALTAVQQAINRSLQLGNVLGETRAALDAQRQRFAQGRVSLFELVSDAQELWQLEDAVLEQEAKAQKAWSTLCVIQGWEAERCLLPASGK